MLNLSPVQPAEDRLVVDDDYTAVAWTAWIPRIYVLDLLKSCAWESNELRSVYNMWVVEEIVGLGELKEVTVSI